jgi:retron-type reverse transcriptase
LTVSTLHSITLRDVAHHERLLAAYGELRRKGGRAPGADGLAFDDLSRAEVAGVLRSIWRRIDDGTYRPAPARRQRIPKRGGGHRTLNIRTIFDRAVGKALALTLSPLLDPLFFPTSFGFRPNLSHLEMLAAIETRLVATDSWVLAIDDIRQAFDYVPIATAVSNYRRLLGDCDLVRLIEAVLRGHSGHQRSRGIDQGCPFSPVTLNVVLHDILDRPLSTDRDLPPLYRYADNLAFACNGVPEGGRALQRARETLQAYGFELKGQDGPPVDLRQPDTHAHLLGFRISRQNGRAKYELGDEAYEELRDELEQAHLSDQPGLTARAVAQGWLWGHAPALETDAEAGVIRRTLNTAGRAGLRGELSESLLRDSIGRAREHWEATRSRAMQARPMIPDEDSLMIRSAPRAGDPPVSSWEGTEAGDSDGPF